MAYRISINGEVKEVDAPPEMPLLWVLRDLLGLTGTKYGCGIAQCRACTVHLDGRATPSCQVPIASVGEQKVTTIEGMPAGNAVQDAWVAEQVPQCGWCQPGQILEAAALLASNPSPTDDDIDAAMSPHICRCGTYPRIRRAIHRAAGGGK